MKRMRGSPPRITSSSNTRLSSLPRPGGTPRPGPLSSSSTRPVGRWFIPTNHAKWQVSYPSIILKTADFPGAGSFGNLPSLHRRLLAPLPLRLVRLALYQGFHPLLLLFLHRRVLARLRPRLVRLATLLFDPHLVLLQLDLPPFLLIRQLRRLQLPSPPPHLILMLSCVLCAKKASQSSSNPASLAFLVLSQASTPGTSFPAVYAFSSSKM